MSIASIGFVLGGALVSGLVFSATIEPYSCRNGLFSREQDELRLAKVIGSKTDRLAFFSDDKGCPEDGEKCRSKSYVLSGDELIVNKVRGEWACGWFDGEKRATVGWVSIGHLQFLPNEEVKDLNRWAGKWKFYENVIELSRDEDGLNVKGEALWFGGKSSSGFPIVHTGEIEGKMTPQDNKSWLLMADEPYSCRANFALLGSYLLVTDNSNCGGMNVRFNGVYTKKR
jgi:hypothetical protein